MDEKPQIITYLEQVASLIPFPLYWGDKINLKILGCNQACLNAIGAKSFEDIIGKSPHVLYSKEMADNILSHVKKVIEERAPLYQEDVVTDITNGRLRYYTAFRAPLFNDNNDIIGIIGTAIEITAEKEAERLKIEAQTEQKKIYNTFKQFSNDLYNLMQTYKYTFLNAELGKNKKEYDLNIQIKLSKREKEVLYYLALNQSPKEISNILSTLENKIITTATVQALINKRLYTKFDVNTSSQLIEKANSLRLIPFLLDQ
ncbi:MAG: Sensory box histidine kinase/response regulator [Burkholderiales bacterium]|jgi:PAS domain S-box-containing protein|nr:Sensory box histidine kinase/response regulator [Burkholderiales bacterium]